MKTHLSTFAALIALGKVIAAEPSLQFGGERIGLPPLSLKESLTQGRASKGPASFGTQLPQFATGKDAALTPNLIPRSTPNLEERLDAARLSRVPRVTRAAGMPIIQPSDDVDFKLRIVSPNPAIDFKMNVQDPSPASDGPASK